MTLTYRGDGAWGTGKGSELTSAEFDGNTYDLDTRITTLEEGGGVEPLSISNITATQSQLTVHMSDGTTTHGPFTLPVARFNPRGAWAAATSYARHDVVYTESDGVFLVVTAHTSAATFSAAAVEYEQIITADMLGGSGATTYSELEDVAFWSDLQSAEVPDAGDVTVWNGSDWVNYPQARYGHLGRTSSLGITSATETNIPWQEIVHASRYDDVNGQYDVYWNSSGAVAHEIRTAQDSRTANVMCSVEFERTNPSAAVDTIVTLTIYQQDLTNGDFAVARETMFAPSAMDDATIRAETGPLEVESGFSSATERTRFYAAITSSADDITILATELTAMKLHVIGSVQPAEESA